jgi:hypothetical protein
METSSFLADIRMCNIERTFTYSNTPMISFSVCYPKVTLCCNPVVQNSINREIQSQVNQFYRYSSNDLYQLAISDYKDSLENEFPFRHYDTVLQYTITYNQDCYLSLYRDQYTYTGGAHGNTIRTSDTWSLMSGQGIPLASFFPNTPDYRTFLIEEITRQADKRLQETPGIFFENYRDLISESFDEDHYYLTPSGIDIYYQQYEIAPYSTGIVVFTIPYAEG